MESVVDDLLSLARIGQARLAPERVDLGALARATAAEWAAREPERVVKVDIAAGLEAWADPALAALAIENLFANAWMYTASRQEAHIEVGSRTIVGQAVFYVRDNGVGFDMANSDRLFAPFARMHEGGGVQAHGIGLACVKRIVLRHGGDIWAEAVPGQGACFHFTLAGSQPSR